MHHEAIRTVEALQLAPHPEGGYYRELFRSPHRVRSADGRVASDDSGWERICGARHRARFRARYLLRRAGIRI